MPEPALLIGVAVLALGTYLVRIVGVLAGRRAAARRAAAGSDAAAESDATPGRLRRSDLVVVVLLAAVALTGAVFEGDELAGWARVAGVVVGAGCAVARLPLAVVIVAAAATTALLRLLGVA